MPFDADWENKIERIYLAKAPAMSARASTQKGKLAQPGENTGGGEPLPPGQKPLTLKGTITVSAGDQQVTSWVAKLTGRTDGRRQQYDPKIISAFETAILTADVEQLHMLLLEVYQANRDPDSGWADHRVFDFLGVIDDDLEPTGVDFSIGLNRFEIQATISSNTPTLESLDYVTYQVSSQDIKDFANAYTGVRHAGTIINAPVKDIANHVARLAAERMPEAFRIKPLTR